ncbi:MAG: hypothetical protein FJ146_08030 [Deltaproteobacteria bacterium]|nr:hypothetical protein [Deltaproteobacteria bacterium]
MSFYRNLNQRGSESGESLVAALVAAAILGVLIVAAGIAGGNMQKARRVIATSDGARALDEAMAEQIASTVKAFVSGRCLAAGTLGVLSVGTIANLDSTNKTSLSSKFPAGDVDVRRCLTKKLNLDGTSASNASGLYLCYQLNVNPSQLKSNDRDTISYNKGAFVQVMVNIKKIGSDTLVTCNDVATGTGQGIEVYYMTKWLMKLNKEQTVKTHVGSFHVSL